MLFFLVIIGYRFHEHNLGTDIFCNLFNLKLPEMGGFDLQLSPGNGNNPELWGLDTFADFLAFSDINLHGLVLHATTEHAMSH